MTRPPDRLPQSARDRELRTAITRGDASSAPGRTGFARQAPRDPAAAVRAYAPPAISGYDRLAVGWRINTPSTLTSSPTYVPAWTFTDEQVGTAIQLNTPDNGGIYIFTPGVYAVNMWVKPVGIDAAAANCSLRGFVDVSGPFADGFDVGTRGGDGGGGRSMLAATSRTYFDPGVGLSGGLFPGLSWLNLDTVNITQIVLEVEVQQMP